MYLATYFLSKKFKLADGVVYAVESRYEFMHDTRALHKQVKHAHIVIIILQASCAMTVP